MLKSVSAFLFLLPLYLFAQYPAKPLNYVTDEAKVLSIEQQEALNTKLNDFEKSSTNQIFVYITASLNGNNLESLSQEIFHNWKIGSQKNDNGLLIAIFVNDHKFRIQTGYGLEGNLPDLLTKKIQDETMRPYFKHNDFYTGLDKGLDKLIYYSANSYQSDEQSTLLKNTLKSWLIGYMPNLALLIIVLYSLYRKNPSKQRTGLAKGLLLVLAIALALMPCIGAIFLFIMVFSISNTKKWGRSYSSGGSYWSGSDSGYSSSDSSSGSDFSGGGGGDSGGGGSSSDW
jgi:uncharacterized protein